MKRIVLCLDGTWNNAYKEAEREDQTKVRKPSNVLKLARGVLPRDTVGVSQICYYDVGIGGSSRHPGAANATLSWVDQKLGGAWGAGFEANVEDAFTFLVHNVEPCSPRDDGAGAAVRATAEAGASSEVTSPDEVFVFGFSRGAAQARALCRFIDWCGGVPCKSDAYYVPELFRAYLEARGRGSAAPVVAAINQRRLAEKRPDPLLPFVPQRVRLLGVWDTVLALGSRVKSQDNTSSERFAFHVGAMPPLCVDHARQALAIDEARFDFRPEIWSAAQPGQDLEQHWFAGSHSNVGGGYLHDGLANLALRWLVKEASAVGLEFDSRFLAAYSGYPMDQYYQSGGGLMKVRDLTARWFRGHPGARDLNAPKAEAHLALDESVLHRLNADPTELKNDGTPRHPRLERYRPENLMAYLAAHPEWDAHITDSAVLAEVTQLRAS